MQDERFLGIVSINACSFEDARKTEFKVTRQAALGLEAEASSETTQRTLYFSKELKGMALVEVKPQMMTSCGILDLMASITE